MCESKQTYDSVGHAKKAAKHRKGRMAYRCPVCHQWHVGQAQLKELRHRQQPKPPRIRLVEMDDGP